MKVVVYQKQRKFTVNNVSIPNIEQLKELLRNEELSQINLKDLQLYNFRITSTRGFLADTEEITNEEIEREVEEGINWQQETIN